MKQALILSSLLLVSPTFAQEQPRHAGYAPLENLVGSWTISGKESTFLERCAWYHGERHIVCNTESKRADGSTSHAMSILSFVPDQGYVYAGIGSHGRYETHQRGTYADGILEYLDPSGDGWTRIRIGPFGAAAVPFNVHSSPDGIEWKLLDSFTYIRVK